MPTYRNDTNHGIYWRHLSWGTAETKAVPLFVPHEALGLTRIDSAPAVPSPILVSQDLTLAAGASHSFEIPAADRYQLSVVAVSGSATVALGGKQIPVDAAADYVGVLDWAAAAEFTVTATVDAVVRVLAEVA